MDMKPAIAYEARYFEILFSTEDQKEGRRLLWKRENRTLKTVNWCLNFY